MAELWTEATDLLERDSSVRALAAEYQAGSPELAREAVTIAVPTVIAGLRGRAENSAGILGLLGTLRTFDFSDLDNPRLFSPRSQRSARASDLAHQIFGNEYAQIVDAVSTTAHIQLISADGIVGSAAWVTFAIIAERHGERLDRQTLIALLRKEQGDLEAQGWADWFQALDLGMSGASAAQTIGVSRLPNSAQLGSLRPGLALPPPIDSASRPSPKAANEPGRYPPPVRSPQRAPAPVRPQRPNPQIRPRPATGYPPPTRGTGPSVNGAPHRSPSIPTPQPNGGRGYSNGNGRHTENTHYDEVAPNNYEPASSNYEPAPSNYYETPPQQNYGAVPGQGRRQTGGYDALSDYEPRRPNLNKKRRWSPIILTGLGLLLVGGAVFALLRSRIFTDTTTGGEPASVGAGSNEATGVENTVPTQGDPGATTDTSSAGEAAADPGGSNVMALVVPMTDIFTETTASGSADVNLNPDTGEICYTFNTDGVGTPMDAHIHRGEFQVKGSILIDFGQLDSPASGCLQSRPVDVQEIISDLPGFYVEMHDVNGVNAVRGQLSTGLSPEDQGTAADQPVAEPADLVFDPAGGGAYATIEQGKVYLRGSVADQATKDLLLDQFTGTEVVDELTIDPAAPLPAGTISLSDAVLFDVASATLNTTDTSVFAVLAAAINAQPGSTVVVIGHTDDTGSEVTNLELSKQRADAVLEELVAQGVPRDSIRTEGAGSTAPVADNSTVEGRAQNRRIEVRVSPPAP